MESSLTIERLMESSLTFEKPSTLDLFDDEEKSFKNLKNLLNQPVGFNSSEKIDPFHPVNQKIGEFDQFPNWVKKYF